ncbi:MAG: hypothetical protein ACYTGB_11115 [Planctomycetota bacterium]
MYTGTRTGLFTHVFSRRFQEAFAAILSGARGEGMSGHILMEQVLDDEFAGQPAVRGFVRENLHHIAALLERGYREITLQPALGGIELVSWR